MEHTILIVDDQPAIHTLLKGILAKTPYSVISAQSAMEALDILATRAVDVVISDERMPGMSGSAFLSVAREHYPDTVRIVLTGYASLESAIKAINEGEIFRFLTKPCRNQELIDAVEAAIMHGRHIRQAGKHAALEDLEKRSPGISQVKRDEYGVIIIDEE